MRACRARGWVVTAGVFALVAGFALAGPALADDDDDEAAGPALDLLCVPAGTSAVNLTASLRPGGDGADAMPQELIVEKIYLEVHSEPGGFWIQLKQPVLPRMTFELCEILQAAEIDAADLDAARFYVKGETIGPEEPEEVEGRCENFPPPGCALAE